MALPTRNNAKDYLRLDLTITAEDTLLDALLVKAQALIEGELGYALTAAARTHVDYQESDNVGVQPYLQLPGPFKSTSPAPVVTDVNGDTVDSSSYTLDTVGMKLRAIAGICFTLRPYSILATIGLTVHPDYAAKYEAIVSVAILDLVSHLYHNRNPALSSFTDEGGAQQALTPTLLPDRVLESINLLPGRNGGMVLA